MFASSFTNKDISKGKVWFGDNKERSLVSMTIVSGKQPETERANEFISALKPKVEGLLPKSAE